MSKMSQRWAGETLAGKVAAIMAELNVATENPGADVDLALRR